MAQTALQLVNRVRRKVRFEDTSDSAWSNDPQNQTILDLLNDAADFVLGEHEWSWEVRHDGTLKLSGELELTGYDVAPLPGTSAGVASKSPTSDAYDWATSGDTRINRVIVGGDHDLSQTALRVVNVLYFTELFLLHIYFERAVGTLSNVALKLVAYEYILPSTVKRVISVRHQERDLRLIEENRSQIFDLYVPSPHEFTSDSPELVIVGGYGASTHTREITTFTTVDPLEEGAEGHILMVYPAPSTDLILHYSYVYAYPRLVDATDTFEGIDQMVETAVVDLAHAYYQQGPGGDVAAGLQLEARTMAHVRRLHAMDKTMPGLRRELRSNFRRGYRRHDVGRLPRNFHDG